MSFEDLVSRLSTQKYPPVDKWSPELTGDMDLTINTRGEWIHEGTIIARAGLVKLLSSVLRREGEEHFLVSPGEKYRINVEDAPFVVVEVDASGSDEDRVIIFRNNVDDLIPLGPEHALWTQTNAATGEPRPYLHVRNGLNALVNRNVFYQLVDLAEERVVDGVTRTGVACADGFFPLDVRPVGR